MSAFVLDCSVAVAWAFEDEAAPEVDALLDRLKVEGAIVPGLWRLEVVNVLTRAERRGRIAFARVGPFLRLLDRLPISVDAGAEERAFREILALARTENLTAYDAAYLELAMRRSAALATRDRALAEAARRAGLETLPG